MQVTTEQMRNKCTLDHHRKSPSFRANQSKCRNAACICSHAFPLVVTQQLSPLNHHESWRLSRRIAEFLGLRDTTPSKWLTDLPDFPSTLILG